MRSYFSLVLAFIFCFFHKFNAQCSNLTAAGTNAVLETEDIYLEDFSNQMTVAAGGVLDASGCNWLIDVSAATLLMPMIILK